MAKRKQSKTNTLPIKHGAKQIHVSEYEITSEPIIDSQYKQLPEAVKSVIGQLHSIAQTKPRVAIPEIQALIQAHPNIPVLYNYLSIAYTAAGEKEKAEEAILNNYTLHPNYLFARCNYAELCLHRKEYETIAAIFNYKFDLKLLYPKRKQFHISEFTGFFGVIGPYFYHTGQRDLAENIYQLLRQTHPRHVYTKRLKRLLYPNFFQRLFRLREENSEKESM
jgi:tetratricopeptide (TPR) repeat protein